MGLFLQYFYGDYGNLKFVVININLLLLLISKNSLNKKYIQILLHLYTIRFIYMLDFS